MLHRMHLHNCKHSLFSNSSISSWNRYVMSWLHVARSIFSRSPVFFITIKDSSLVYVIIFKYFYTSPSVKRSYKERFITPLPSSVKRIVPTIRYIPSQMTVSFQHLMHLPILISRMSRVSLSLYCIPRR